MNAELQCPNLPNFVRVKVADKEITVDVADLPDDDIDSLAKLWRTAMYGLKEKRLKARKDKK